MGFSLGGLFGDSSDAYDDYANSLRDFSKNYQPWVDRGNQAGDYLMTEQQKLMSDPNFLQNLISQGYQSSPYQQQLLNDTTSAMNMNAANTGMIQSPTAQRALNDRVNSMTGQFMNDYINRGMSSYNLGFGGMENTQNMGMNALNQQGQMNSAAAQSNMMGDISGQSAWNNIIGGIAGFNPTPGQSQGGGTLGQRAFNWMF
jgi:hypothetical protein